jgi:putative hydrolase of the HAD superfamily
MQMANTESQTFLIDADDTLWENNVYFERAIANFISFLNHQQYTPVEVRAKLNEVERDCIVKHGYGIHSFANALIDCFESLSDAPVTPEMHETIRKFAFQIAEHPIEVIAGIPETLEYLARRHHLILMTKGAIAEQTGKIERSGLKDFFAAYEVVAEKNASAYKVVVEKYGLDSSVTWMVGNSPKSDVNPALAAGLHAVFVPHDNTWVLEHEAVSPPPTPQQRLLQVRRFSELQQHF